MSRDVTFDFRRGGGSALEVLYGTLDFGPTSVHEVGTSTVLPTPTRVDIVNGQATLTGVESSPDGPDPAWAYSAVVRNTEGKAWGFIAGVPTGTTAIAFADLPKFTTPGAGEKIISGKSAYDVAVDEGFVGTKAEWVASLEGDPGVPGADGSNVLPTDEGISQRIEDPASQTRASLNAAIGDGVAPVSTDVGSLAAQRVQKVVALPVSLGLNIPIDIIRTRDGYLTNMVAKTRHVPRTGPTYYVDPVGGLNTNDGLTPATAFKTPFYASQKNANDWAEIVVTKTGTFDRAEGVFLMQKGGTFRTEPGVKATIICGDRLTTWTANETAWQAAIASCNGVFDDGYKDAYGDPSPLMLAASVADVQATPGTYYFEAETVYVRTHDSRTPDTNLYVGRPVAGTGWHANVAGDDATVYLEGIEWWGGTTAGNFTAKGNGYRVLAKDCGWHGAGTGNGLSPWGCAEVILQDCTANHNKLDGFNYTDNNGRTGQFIEINCRARNNGRNGGSNNGSTSHDNYKGVRIAGDYVQNEGANVADVGAAKAYNVGCTAGGSTSYKQDFYAASTAEVWVDGCLTVSDQSLVTIDTAVIRTRDTVASGAVSGNVVGF